MPDVVKKEVIALGLKLMEFLDRGTGRMVNIAKLVTVPGGQSGEEGVNGVMPVETNVRWDVARAFVGELPGILNIEREEIESGKTTRKLVTAMQYVGPFQFAAGRPDVKSGKGPAA